MDEFTVAPYAINNTGYELGYRYFIVVQNGYATPIYVTKQTEKTIWLKRLQVIDVETFDGKNLYTYDVECDDQPIEKIRKTGLYFYNILCGFHNITVHPNYAMYRVNAYKNQPANA
jgi:hypothetical protein